MALRSRSRSLKGPTASRRGRPCPDRRRYPSSRTWRGHCGTSFGGRHRNSRFHQMGLHQPWQRGGQGEQKPFSAELRSQGPCWSVFRPLSGCSGIWMRSVRPGTLFFRFRSPHELTPIDVQRWPCHHHPRRRCVVSSSSFLSTAAAKRSLPPPIYYSIQLQNRSSLFFLPPGVFRGRFLTMAVPTLITACVLFFSNTSITRISCSH